MAVVVGGSARAGFVDGASPKSDGRREKGAGLTGFEFGQPSTKGGEGDEEIDAAVTVC